MSKVIDDIKKHIKGIFIKNPKTPTIQLDSKYSHRLNYLYIAMSSQFMKIDSQVSEIEIAAFKASYPLIPKNINVMFILQESMDEIFDALYYAKRIKSLFPAGDPLLKEMIKSLIVIGYSDDFINIKEMALLKKIAQVFAISDQELISIITDSYIGKRDCPYQTLGVDKTMTFEIIYMYYKRLIKNLHPDIVNAKQDIDSEFRYLIFDKFNIVQKAYAIIKNEHQSKNLLKIT